jgi:hypothetical protein
VEGFCFVISLTCLNRLNNNDDDVDIFPSYISNIWFINYMRAETIYFTSMFLMVTCRVVHATKVTGSSSDDWIY